jgi:hypothetical protein
LLALGAELRAPVLLLGWAWMAFGLYALGVWLENRPWVVPLELLRLLLNLPALWLAQGAGLLPAETLAWALLLGYSLASGIALCCARRHSSCVYLVLR